MKFDKNQYCVIMAGGAGTRFWPMSTQKFPKQFQDILGIGQTMLQRTYSRIRPLISPENIFVITNRDFVEIAREQLPELSRGNIIGEPMSKNTAACNLYIANKIFEKNSNASIVVLPSDHLVMEEEIFRKTVKESLEIAAKEDCLIAIGMPPTKAEVSYGYIQYEPKAAGKLYKAKNITQKPSVELAQVFLESGDFLWNTEILIWNVRTILAAFQEHLPEMVEHFSSCRYNEPSEESCLDIIYPKLPKISINQGILEKANNVFVVSASIGWSDLGTWNKAYEHAKKNEADNSLNTKYALGYNAYRNIIRLKNEKKAVVISGLEDYIVVDTDTALLICPRSEDQKIKEFIQDLKHLKNGTHFL